MADYAKDVIPKLESLSFTKEIIGTIRESSAWKTKYPIYKVIAGNLRKKGNKNVLISAGIHPEEPAGVYAALEFLEKHAQKYLNDFTFFVYPCISPYAYESPWLTVCIDYDDVNSDFKNKSVTEEARLIKKSLAKNPRRYLFAMDLHETPADLAADFYLYEGCRPKGNSKGRQIIMALKENSVKTYSNPDLFGRKIEDGIVVSSDGSIGTLEYYLYQHYTNNAFTLESPAQWPLRKRIDAHILSLETALKNYRA